MFYSSYKSNQSKCIAMHPHKEDNIYQLNKTKSDTKLLIESETGLNERDKTSEFPPNTSSIDKA